MRKRGGEGGSLRATHLDVTTVAYSYGSHPRHSKWNPDADFNGDRQVDLRDVVIVADILDKAIN